MNKLIHDLIDCPEFQKKVQFESKLYAANDKILVQGEVHNEFYFIKSGVIKVSLHTDFEEGSQYRLGFSHLEANDIFGELAFFEALPTTSESLPATADVVALTDSEIIAIHIPSFHAFLTEHPHIGYEIVLGMGSTLVKRLRHADKTIINLYAWGMKANKLDQYLK